MKTIKSSPVLILVLAVIFILSGCAKRATKEQLIQQRSKLIAWYESDDFKKLVLSYLNDDGSIKDQTKFEKDIKAAENKKIDEIVQAMGFKSQEEFKATEDIINSTEVKEMDKKLEETATNAASKIVMELISRKAASDQMKQVGIPQ